MSADIASGREATEAKRDAPIDENSIYVRISVDDIRFVERRSRRVPGEIFAIPGRRVDEGRFEIKLRKPIEFALRLRAGKRHVRDFVR